MTRQEMLVIKFELKPKRRPKEIKGACASRPSEIESKNGNQSVSVSLFFLSAP